MERIKEIFEQIKRGHPLWVAGDNAYKERLEKAFVPFFTELETLGVSWYFSEALLLFGKEFLDGFGVEPMSEKDIKERALADKSGALIWESMPMKGDKVGIKIIKKQLPQQLPQGSQVSSHSSSHSLPHDRRGTSQENLL